MAGKPAAKRQRVGLAARQPPSTASTGHAPSGSATASGIVYVPHLHENGQMVQTMRSLTLNNSFTSASTTAGTGAGGNSGPFVDNAPKATSAGTSSPSSTTRPSPTAGSGSGIMTDTISANTTSDQQDFSTPYNAPVATHSKKTSSSKGPPAPPAARAMGQWLCCACMLTTCWFNVPGKRCQRGECRHLKCECCFFLGHTLDRRERLQQIKEAQEVVRGLKAVKDGYARGEGLSEEVMGDEIVVGDDEGETDCMDESSG